MVLDASRMPLAMDELKAGKWKNSDVVNTFEKYAELAQGTLASTAIEALKNHSMMLTKQDWARIKKAVEKAEQKQRELAAAETSKARHQIKLEKERILKEAKQRKQRLLMAANNWKEVLAFVKKQT